MQKAFPVRIAESCTGDTPSFHEFEEQQIKTEAAKQEKEKLLTSVYTSNKSGSEATI